MAWTAELFGQNAKIHMPKGSLEMRLASIREFGAESYLSDLNYDDTVLEIAKRSNGGQMIQ